MESRTLVARTLGRYRIAEQLGQGGMGVVYRAYDPLIGRDVALKTLPPGVFDAPDARARLRREAIWLSRCDDPHIAAVYDAGQIEGVDFIAMELMVSTLHARAGSGLASARDLIGIGAQILLGLAAAHRAGVVHRDVKPANIGVTDNGTVKLLDFGIADPLPRPRDGQETTAPERLPLVGTMDYMAPEQLRGDPVDERADVYSTGAVLYELACGRRPFGHLHGACLIDAILNHRPLAPARLNAALPAALERCIVRAMAKKPEARFQTALAMMDALVRMRLAGPAAFPLEPALTDGGQAGAEW